MKKNGMALLVAVMVAFGSLSGCGAKETDSTSIKTEKVEDKESIEVVTNEEVATEDTKMRKVTEIIKHETYYEDGNIRTSFEREYDENGNEIRHTNVDSNFFYTSEHPEGCYNYSVKEVEYEYDEYGRQIKRVEYEDGRIKEQRLYKNEYDSFGNLIKETEYTAGGNVKGLTEYENEYDLFGNLVKVTAYTSDGNVRNVTEYEYDIFQSLIKVISYDSENNITFEYDKSTKLMRNIFYVDGNIYMLTEYDEDGNEIKREEYSYNEGRVSSKRVQEYDEKGNLLKQIMYVNPQEHGIAREEPLIIEVAAEVEYDENGNILQGVQYNEFNDEGKREITAKAETEFDEEGRRIRETEYGENGNKLYMSEYTYGENGKKIETRYDFTTGDMRSNEYQCKYDAKGNQILNIKYGVDGGELEREEWEYDESGNLIWHMLYESWGIFEEEVWEYDENGNMSTYTKHDEGRIVEYTEYITLEKESLF